MMTQSKQEAAERNARIRAEKLRENLARRKQQLRQQGNNTEVEIADMSGGEVSKPTDNSVG